MRRAFMLVIVVTMVVLSATPGLANNTWNEYHWANGDPDTHGESISLSLVDDLTAYGTEYSAVLDDWDQDANGGKGPLSLISSKATPGDRPLACGNVATDEAGALIEGTIHVCNDGYGKNGWLGLARIWLASDGHIEAGVALMNDSYMFEAGSVYNDPVARRHVLCQEIGHTFGLDHQGSPKKQSCMNDRWGLTNSAFQGPNQHDFDTLSELYGAADTDGSGGGKTKPCNPNRPQCPSGANVQFVPRPGGGWIVTFTVPVGRSLH